MAGFYLLFTEDVKGKAYKRLWTPLTFGFSGLMMTHMIGCLMVGLFSVLVCLLVPLMQYMLTEELRINKNLSEKVISDDYFSPFSQFYTGGKDFLQLVYRAGDDRVCPFAFWVCMDFFPVERLAEKSIYGIGNAEYLPVTTDTRRFTKELQVDEALEISENKRFNLFYNTSVINTSDQERTIIYPVLYYTGYQAVDTQSAAYLKTMASDNGCAEVISVYYIL